MWPPSERRVALAERIFDNDIGNLRGLIEGEAVMALRESVNVCEYVCMRVCVCVDMCVWCK